MTPMLSPRTNLRFLKTRAKAILKAHSQRNPDAIDVLRHLRRFSKTSASEIFDSEIELHDVQYSIALQQGFKSWNDLRKALMIADRNDEKIKTVVKRTKSEVKLGVTGVSEEIKKRLLEDYYSDDDGGCVRTYPADAAKIDATAVSFKKYGAAFISQSYGNEKVLWQDALLAFLKLIHGKDIEWLLSGSCALAVRGLDLAPRGVDLVMRMKDLEIVRELFSESTIIPFAECSDWVCLGYGAAFLAAPISIGFEPQAFLDKKKPSDSGPYAMANAETVEWNGYRINVPPIELSLNINRARGRTERAEMIKKFIASVQER